MKVSQSVSWKVVTTLLISLLLSACSSITPQPLLPANEQTQCMPALTELDQLAHQYAGTLSDQRITDTPWLRNNRFLHSFQQRVLGNAHESNSPRKHGSRYANFHSKPQLSTLLRRMNTLAITGLNTELRQIPTAQLNRWQTTHRIQTAPKHFIQRCSTTLLNAQMTNPTETKKWLSQLKLSDSYSTLQRVLGFYPLAAIPFRWGVINEQHELQEQWGQIQGKAWRSYMPSKANSTQSAVPVRLPKDALQIPVFNTQATQKLFAQHAPTWLIDSDSDVNRPGTPYRQHNKIEVDTKRHTTYTYLSYGRWRNQITTQLNYIIWFSERPALSTFDWVAGKHDAVIFRIHLDASQNILAYDSIHLCGCWYRLFLPEGVQFQANNSYNKEPITVEYVQPARKMQVYISRDTHQIIDLKPAATNTGAVNAKPYRLQRFEQLLAIPIFNRQGYVPASERPERWFFWPMGVRNPGAVRRLGEHAVSFIGKRHFDDPNLLHEVGVR